MATPGSPIYVTKSTLYTSRYIPDAPTTGDDTAHRLFTPRFDIPMPRWSVSKIRKKAEYLSVVTPPDERVAFREAVKQLGIETAQQNRLAVTKLDDRDDN